MTRSKKKPARAGWASEKGALTILLTRSKLDICHSGMRLCELKKSGFRIDTIWVFESIAPGKPMHRVANYVLRQKYPVQLSLFDQGGVI